MAWDMINQEKAVRATIEKVQRQVELENWKDLQNAPCDFTGRRFDQAQYHSATIDMDEYSTHMRDHWLSRRRAKQATAPLTPAEHRALRERAEAGCLPDDCLQ